MQKRTTLQQQLLVAGCAGMLFASAGCRSAMPKWNMFGSKAPSAETLAGEGPTVTYPAPPSDSATPSAIASIAGGTAASPDAIAASAPPSIAPGSIAPGSIAPGSGFDATTPASLAASKTNSAAARANGFNQIAGLPKSGLPKSSGRPGYAAPTSAQSKGNSAVPAIPTGYQFGTKKSSPPPKPSGSGYATPSASGYTLPKNSTITPPPASPNVGEVGFGLPPIGTSAATAASPGGFSMPGAAGTTPTGSTPTMSTPGAMAAQPFTPKPPTSTPSMGMSLPAAPTGQATGASTVSTGASSPKFSTASAALAPRASGSMGSDSGSYAPGSTSGSGAYPTTSGYPSTGTEGSFYR